jgi:hypothetical protein
LMRRQEIAPFFAAAVENEMKWIGAFTQPVKVVILWLWPSLLPTLDFFFNTIFVW